VPSHSCKFAAPCSAQGREARTLIGQTQGSHGYRPTDKQIAELADQWAFTAAQMAITTPGTSAGER
jgi:prolyl oligopeptidase PreP (S9A serine peptidase family)